jgi:predicted HAD superfamily Cof-like phosphohydrolase
MTKDVVYKHPHDAVMEFHRAFNLPIGDRAMLADKEVRALRRRLLNEEFTEYLQAETKDDLVEIADALADIIYIACGTAVSYGIPLDRVFAEVHRSNMAKLGPNGKPILRDDGKVMKPANWSPPNVSGIIKSAS